MLAFLLIDVGRPALLSADFIAQRDAEEPFATFSAAAHLPQHAGGCCMR
jgi:hypothetical protein